MKKSLVSALTTALVVGAASTTFAAANPFSDVPADHWAYDAVTQLAADGVIEGYGDTTFRGDRNITRYEMAQMVARAMARTDVDAATKAMIDKLAAEFADELNNLGVRVSNLERNADMVKWTGEARYTYTSRHPERANRLNDDEVKFRLEPTAEVNDHWHVKARIDASSDMATDSGRIADASAAQRHNKRNQNTTATLERIWAQGDYGKFQAKLGKFGNRDDDILINTNYSGVEASYGKQLKFIVGAGRLNSTNIFTNGFKNDPETAANYQFYGLDYKLKKFNAGLHYHHLNMDDFAYKKNGRDTDKANIWLLRAGYRFDKNFAIKAFYANNTAADVQDHAWTAEFNYKGAKKSDKGSWGAWLAYRYEGINTIVKSPDDAVYAGEKAMELGVNYTPFKNVVATARYAFGKNIATDRSVKNLWARVQFFF